MFQDPLYKELTYLKGVGPKKAELLKKEMGLVNYKNLLQHYPFRYVDRSEFINISDITSDLGYVQIKGTFTSLTTSGKGKGLRLNAIFKDNTASVSFVWFKGIKWVREFIKPNTEYVVFAKFVWFKGAFSASHPEITLSSEFTNKNMGGFQPVYNSTERLKSAGLDSRGLSKLCRTAIEQIEQSIIDPIAAKYINALGFYTKAQALKEIHFPSSYKNIKKARMRIIFDELFFNQLVVLKRKKHRESNSKGNLFSIVGDNFNDFFNNKLPFTLTNAQKRVIKEIRKDCNTGFQMNRLLQGDVGSGKTLVALLTILIASDNGYQSCLMAPTEILAQQHYYSICKMLDDMDFNVKLLTGSTKTAQRRIIHKELQDGSLQLLIGTHALIEDTVQFKNLGYAVIDEQHRFGVAQRSKLYTKNDPSPHVLVMTATPIPRTLSLTSYGDLSVSIIDELPPGRKPISTMHFYDSARNSVFHKIREEVNKGRQVYIVYPLIEESKALEGLKDLEDGFEALSRSFPLPDYAVSMVHGRMKSDIKDFEMQRFKKGETHIMVATTVIEVGVDVPNASMMIIENAERFGLSQLHQLRGRVGRGSDESFCILMTADKLSPEGKKRIAIMCETNDGFKIAQADLEIRGPGDVSGTRQSGSDEFIMANIIKDEKILNLARQVAEYILNKDEELEQNIHKSLNEEMKSRQDYINWREIS